MLGPVSASTAQTFREVVDVFRIPPTLALTRKDFLALGEKQRNEAKQVPFFVPACFRASPSKRIYEKATHCNLIFLDIDPEKENRDGKWVETGRYPAAPFINDPDSLHTALAGFSFAAHITASSTSEKPRMRIVVDAQAIPLTAYPRAAMQVAALLGLPSVTKESKVAVQPMFLPVMFSDSTDAEHPLITYSFDGRPFTVRDIGEDLFPEFNEPRKSTEHGIDALEFLRAPVPEIKLATAKEALFQIDADVSRADWLNCAAALKHQFTHCEEQAFEIFDDWSQMGEKYGGEEETQAIWKSLRPTPIGRVPITIRSLLRSAVIAGWDDTRVRENCFNRVLEWMENCGTAAELLDKGVQKILATPLISAVQEDVLVDQIRTQVKKRFGYTVSATNIRKDIARIKAEIKAQEKPAEKMREPVWAKGVCYIAAAQDFYRHRTGEKYKSEAFNAAYSRHLLPTEESLKDSGIPVTPATLSKPVVSPTDFALNHLKIVTAYDYAYDPSQPTEMFFVNRGKRYVNTYAPTYPELDNKYAGSAGELLQVHIENLVFEPEYRRSLIDFMAFMVQSPGRKIRWATLIQSVEGAGKTFLAEVMKAVLGKEHVKTISGATIKSGYNEWSFGHQLVVLEEVRVAGTNRHEIMNALKPLVTNDEVDINEKFRSSRNVENISNYMMFSNHHDALALTPGDRRYFVLKSPLQTKQQVLELGENYFPPLYAMLRDKPGALRAWLSEWEISPDFRPDGHAPRTKYVQDLINDSANDVTAAIRRILLEGDNSLVQYDIVSAKTLLDMLTLEEGLTRVSAQQVSHVLREEGYLQIGRHLFGEDRHYLWTRGKMDEKNAVETAHKRIKNGLKNLCMELLF